MRLLIPAKPPARRSRAAVVFPLYLTMALVGLAWSALRGHYNPWLLPERGVTGDAHPVSGILVGLALGLALVAASRLTVTRYQWARWLERDFRDRLGPLSPRECLLLALASSIGEELLFRGALLPTVGLGWSSLIFAGLHLGRFPRYLPWTLSALVAGLSFGQLYLWSGDLTGPVLAHFLVNYLNLRHLGHRPS